MMKKHVTACLTAAAVLAAPVAVSGTLTAGAIAQEASAPAPAADQKPDVLGLSLIHISEPTRPY